MTNRQTHTDTQTDWDAGRRRVRLVSVRKFNSLSKL